MTRVKIVRIILIVVAAFVIFGPLSSLVIWSVAEKWFWPNVLPQEVGLFYWGKVFQGRMVQALEVGVLIAVVVTALSLVMTVPLGYVLARFNVPFKALILLIFMLPQAFPQLPVFANATVYLYRANMGGKVSGVILIHMVGALVYAVWTMTAVFKSIPVSLEEAAINLSPFVLTLPVFMYNASQGYELPVASITALLLMVPGVVLLLVLERYLKAEYLSSFGRI